MAEERNGEGDGVLVASCVNFCNLFGDPGRKGVFSRAESDEEKGEKTVYYCGLGMDDCVVCKDGQRLSNVEQTVGVLVNRPAGEPRYGG